MKQDWSKEDFRNFLSAFCPNYVDDKKNNNSNNNRDDDYYYNNIDYLILRSAVCTLYWHKSRVY